MRNAGQYNFRDSRAQGFSLAELVLALGVLAIGMTMAAALFPAALKLNELSTNDSIGTIIAQNGLAISQAVLDPSDFPDPNNDPNLGEPNCQAFRADPNLLQYRPDPSAPASTRGFLVLGRRLKDNTCQLVIVSYDMHDVANKVTAEIVTINEANPKLATVTLDKPDLGESIGAYLICPAKDPNDHRIMYARITGNNNGVTTLDHPMDDVVGSQGFVVVERAGGDNGPIQKKGPVMAVLVAETTLGR